MNKQNILIDDERLKNTLEEFANFGRTGNNGVTRLALSEEDHKARDYFQHCCENVGAKITVDDMGNMYGTLAGKDNNKPPIVMGSHLDTVVKGGRFDGVLGVLSGLEVISTLVDNNIKPEISIVAAAFTNEEGSRFEPAIMGSGVLSGKFEKAAMMKKTDKEGITFEESLHNIGYAGKKEHRLKRANAFIELHVEQGPYLEKESLNIGVVEGSVGKALYEIEVLGESDHGGSTPMYMRKDAFFAANSLINKVRDKLGLLDNNLVYTIGQLEVFPNLHSVIPNKVIFTIDVRHNNNETMKQAAEIIMELKKSHVKENCAIKIKTLWERKPLNFDKEVCNQIEQSVKKLKYPYKRMMSWAGHDAIYLSSYIPSAMIFVPSVNGKSHDEDEFTKIEDCVKGANVLLQTVLAMGVELKE